jgi:hypothetical protein
MLSAVAVVPISAGARTAPRLIGANGQGTLLFVGDSLTVGSDAFGSLASKLRSTRIWTRVTIDARVGRTASVGAATIASRLTAHTTAVIVALGTNDMISRSSATYPGWVIDKVMVQAKGRPVLWFNLKYSDTSRPDWRSRAFRFNRALRTAQKKWPTLQVADWNTAFSPNTVSRFISDGIHLTVPGYRTRATYSLRQVKLFGETVVNATTTTTTTTTTTSSTTTTTSSTTSSSTSSTSSTTTTVPSPTTT